MTHRQPAEKNRVCVLHFSPSITLSCTKPPRVCACMCVCVHSFICVFLFLSINVCVCLSAPAAFSMFLFPHRTCVCVFMCMLCNEFYSYNFTVFAWMVWETRWAHVSELVCRDTQPAQLQKWKKRGWTSSCETERKIWSSFYVTELMWLPRGCGRKRKPCVAP